MAPEEDQRRWLLLDEERVVMAALREIDDRSRWQRVLQRLYAGIEWIVDARGHADRDSRQRRGMGNGVVGGEVPRRGVGARICSAGLVVARPDRRADRRNCGEQVGVLLGKQDRSIA